MKKHMLIALILLCACVMPKTPKSEPQIYGVAPLFGTFTPRVTPIGTIAYPTPKSTLVEAVQSPILPTVTPKPSQVVIDPNWMALASEIQGKAQRAVKEKLWEDIRFKEDAYRTLDRMIYMSQGKVKEDSKEILKRFRWGMEFMDRGQLEEVIHLLDQYGVKLESGS